MTVAKFFDEMSYGPAPEADTEARAWIARHKAAFGHFINGGFVPSAGSASFETREPATGASLAMLAAGSKADVDAAVAAARKAQGPWAKLPGHARARHLYALARMIQQATAQGIATREPGADHANQEGGNRQLPPCRHQTTA